MSSKILNPTPVIHNPEFLKVSTIDFIKHERMCNYAHIASDEGILKTSPSAFGIKKSEYLQINTIKFLENERSGEYVQIPATLIEVRYGSDENAHIDEQSVYSRSQMMPTSTIEIRDEAGIYAPKRFITTCYFKPKQNPVSYSETVILVLGSNKKHYFDTIFYQTKLVPFRWIETLTTITKPSEQVFRTEHHAFIAEPKYHYMSLEPQQIVAA